MAMASNINSSGQQECQVAKCKQTICSAIATDQCTVTRAPGRMTHLVYQFIVSPKIVTNFIGHTNKLRKLIYHYLALVVVSGVVVVDVVSAAGSDWYPSFSQGSSAMRLFFILQSR